MPAEEIRVSNSALKTEIAGLGDKIEDVKKLLVAYEERIRCLERAGDKTTPLTNKRLELLEKTIERHEKDIDDLTKLIDIQAQNITNLTNNVNTMQTIWKWALGIFTAVMIAVIILLVTGQAEMIFK